MTALISKTWGTERREGGVTRDIGAQDGPGVAVCSALAGVDLTGFQSSRNMLRHTAPSRLMFGWYILVLHVTFGGSCGYNAGMAKVKLYCEPTQVVQDGGRGEDCQERKGASTGMRPEGYLLPASHLDAGPAARVRRDDDGEVGEVVGVGELDLRDGATVQVRDVCRATGASRWRGGTAKGQERECGWVG